jgi:hypothetical protein
MTTPSRRRSLADIRAAIDGLADQTGAYYVTCASDTMRPVPAATHRFASRTTAQEAIRLTRAYRDALRRYDPQVRCCTLTVRREPATADGSDRSHGEVLTE